MDCCFLLSLRTMVCHSVEQRMVRSTRGHLVARASSLVREVRLTGAAAWPTEQATLCYTRSMDR
jgi:hypothetical protein